MILSAKLHARLSALPDLGTSRCQKRPPLGPSGRYTATQRPGRLAMAALPLLALLIGCATPASDKAFNAENFLIQAGFTYRVADTPQRLEQLKKLPQLKLIHRERDGRRVYYYADAADCKCLWSGDETAYRNLQQRLYSAKLTARQQKGLWSETMDRLGPSEPAGADLEEMDPAMVPIF